MTSRKPRIMPQVVDPLVGWKLGAIFCFFCSLPLATVDAFDVPSAGARPNVLVILTDDQGWGDLSLNGNQNLQTPNIDSLAISGARFDRFYVCPVCSPTRAEFLTGRYHTRGGVYSTSAGGERLNLDEVTIADSFRAAGYRTGAFGKWHNGMQYPYHPNGRGFDEFYGFCSGHWGDYFAPPLERNGEIVQGSGFCVDDFTSHAIRFMSEAAKAEQPFFAYLPLNTPHSPMQVPDAYWDRFESKTLAMRNREPDRENVAHTRCALAMCENIDWNVGRLLQKLDELAIADNTIVVYFCDNGPNGARWNGDMKGRKGSTDEGGVRSPALFRWPAGITGGQVVEQNGAAIDLLPTLAEMCDIELTSAAPLDGRSLVPLLCNEGPEQIEWPDREIISHWRGKVSVRNERFLLDNEGQLFELDSDPGQRDNLADRFPDEAAALSQIASRFRTEIDGFDNDQRPFPLGHEDYRFTQLPARDMQGTGGIERSNKYPNCSFFSNWTRTEEEIRMEVMVGQAGDYQVDLHYACAPANVGSAVTLSVGDALLRFEIDEAHDPPLRGQENDRVPRAESYVKDFQAKDIGTVRLKAGAATLRLRADSIPADEVMDFRLLMFKRVENQ